MDTTTPQALPLPVKLGLANLIAWMPVYVVSGLLRGYDISGDLSNGEVIRASWMFIVSPLCAGVSVVWSAIERDRCPARVPRGSLIAVGLPFPGIIVAILALLG